MMRRGSEEEIEKRSKVADDAGVRHEMIHACKG
jgi:hypothetical protein